MIIAHNMAAMSANRQLNTANSVKKKSAQKLSSGFRINQAADNAAGLSISEKMRGQIRGLNRASNNIQDGISYVQVADGALNEVQEMLQRMNELVVQAANDTNTSQDREYINDEIQQLKYEIDKIYEETSFNERRIWDETLVPYESKTIVNTVTEEYPAVIFHKLSADSYTDNTNCAAMPKSSISFVADLNGLKASWTGYDGTKYESETIAWPATLAGTHSFKLSNHMDYAKYPAAVGIDFTFSYTVNEHSTPAQVISAFNKSSASLNAYPSNTVDTIKTYADSSGPQIISTSASINYDAMLASGKNFEAFDTTFIEFVNMKNPALPGINDSEKFSFTFQMPNIGSVTASVNSAQYTGNYSSDLSDRAGENIWWKETTLSNGKKMKSSLSYTIDGNMDGILSSITNSSGHSLWDNNASGGSIRISFNLNAANPFTCANGAKASTVGSLSLVIPVNKSKASDKAGLIDYITDAIANLSSVDISDNDAANKGYSRVYRLSDTKSTVKATYSYDNIKTEYLYQSENQRDILIQAGANSNQTIHLRYNNMNIQLLGLKDTNALTAEDAENAINEVHSAMTLVNAQRSEFGAYQNRLEHAMMADNITAENIEAAEARIRDSDIADEMVTYSKQSILEQAGHSILAQMNQSAQNILSLLQ